MWARVKGKTENALLALPFKGKYMFPLLRWLAPRFVTTTERVGRAMLRVAKQGADKPVLENADINALGS